jgi:cobalt-zinc-cadmium efflux system outer membrane protein
MVGVVSRRGTLVRASKVLCFLGISVAHSGCAGGTKGGASAVTPVAPLAGERAGERAGARAAKHLAAASQLERSAFVRAVLDANPSLETGRSAVLAARARSRQAGAFEDPMLELGLAPLSIAAPDVPIGYEVTVSQKLPWFGKRRLERALADAEVEASRADYEAMRRELALGAVALYDQYYVNARSLELNAQHLQLLSTMRDAVTAALEVGRAGAQDQLSAEGELGHLEHDAVKLQIEREITVAQMNELLHRAPELPLPPPPRELPSARAQRASAATLEQRAVVASSELRALRQRARAEQARAERAEREGYPDVTVSASYNSMWDMPEHRLMVGLGFDLPLQGAQRAGAADEARAQRAGLEGEAVRETDATRTRVFVTLKRLQESEHVIRLYEMRLVPLARQRVEAARSGFATGRADFGSMIEAERALRAAELELLLARAEQYRRGAELERALGTIPGLEQEDAR